MPLSIVQEPTHATQWDFTAFNVILKDDVQLQLYLGYVVRSVVVDYIGKTYGPDGQTHIIDHLEHQKTGAFQRFGVELSKLLAIENLLGIPEKEVERKLKEFAGTTQSKTNGIRHLVAGLDKMRDLVAMKKVNVYSIDVNM